MEPKTKNRLIAGGIIAAAVGATIYAFAITPANAADLGGNCCADLEERVAELEATTARKGNRKVSLTVSGEINKALFYYDVAGKNDVAVIDNSNDPSRVTFQGSGKIAPDWSAGYVLELGVGKTNANVDLRIGFTGVSTDNAIYTRQSFAYVSGPVGTLSLGLRDNAATTSRP